MKKIFNLLLPIVTFVLYILLTIASIFSVTFAYLFFFFKSSENFELYYDFSIFFNTIICGILIYISIRSHKKRKLIEQKVFEALGEASMCWSETPKGVFDSSNATEIGNRLIKEIENVYK